MMNSFSAPDPEKVLANLGDLAREKVFVGDRTFLIDAPARPDKLLDDPDVHEASQRDDYMPYWAEIWPAARMLAKVLLSEPDLGDGTALELGCGLGLSGVVALSRGLEVIFSDYDACALKFAADNAILNGFHRFRTLQLDWRDPPPELKVPLVIGSDLIYEIRSAQPMATCIAKVLLPGGRCLLTVLDRIPAEIFQKALRDAGLSYTTQMLKAGVPGGRREKGTLYRITRAD